jgi:hypothetical protein
VGGAVATYAAGVHDPWQALRELSGWTLRWADLPDGRLGETDHDRRVITLSTGLSCAQQRCTLAHELEHAADPAASERVVRLRTARRLVPYAALVAAAAWCGDEWALARELDVDVEVLRDRLGSLTPAEAAGLRPAGWVA